MSGVDNRNGTNIKYSRGAFVKQSRNKTPLLQTNPNLARHPKRKYHRKHIFFFLEINIKIQDGGLAQATGRERRSTAIQKKIDPEKNTQSLSSLRTETRNSTRGHNLKLEKWSLSSTFRSFFFLQRCRKSLS